MRYEEHQEQKRIRRMRHVLSLNMVLALLATAGGVVSAYREHQLDKPAAAVHRVPIGYGDTSMGSVESAGVSRTRPAGYPYPFVDRSAFDSLRREVADLSRAVAGQRPLAPAARDSVRRLDQRLARLESVIEENPTKSVEMVLLRKDLEMAQASQQQANARFEADVSRFYDEMHWAFGLILGLFGLAIAHYLKSARSDSKGAPKATAE